MILDNIIMFCKSQKEELLKDGWFKIYAECADCGTSFIFKNSNLSTKKVCICTSNNWIMKHIKECE